MTPSPRRYSLVGHGGAAGPAVEVLLDPRGRGDEAHMLSYARAVGNVDG
jgi:hypothetical protein